MAIASVLISFQRDTAVQETRSEQYSTSVKYRSLGDVVAVSGRLRPIQVVEVGAQVSGQLQALNVRAGDPVSKGDVIARIDATIQQNIVAAQQATLKALEARLPPVQSYIDLVEADLARQQRLMRLDATSKVDLEHARNAVVQARSTMIQLRSEIESQKAIVASEEAKLNYSVLRAPISGVVVSVNFSAGQTVNSTQEAPAILSIANYSVMLVEAQVPEAKIGKLSVGAGVSFSTLGGGSRKWRGTLRQIIPRATTTDNIITYTSLFEVDNIDGALMPGMTAQVSFEVTKPREVLALPVDMLHRFSDSSPTGGRNAMVRVINDSGNHELREIKVGEIGSVYAEVLEGLKEGDLVLSPN